MGVVASDEKSTTKISDKIIDGNFVNVANLDQIVIGRLMAQSLMGNPYGKNRARAGMEVELINHLGWSQRYTIGGVADAKSFIPNWLVILSKEQLEKLDPSQKDSEIAVKLKNPRDGAYVKSLIKQKNPNLNVYIWNEQAGYVNDMIGAVSFMTNLVNILVIIIVFVLVSIIIFINILQKKRQIGVLKSMGIDNKFVFRIYLSETMIYLAFSWIIGFLIFLVVHLYLLNYPMPTLIGDFHTVINWQTAALSIAALFGAAIAGTIIPAILAAKIKIVDVIRDNV